MRNKALPLLFAVLSVLMIFSSCGKHAERRVKVYGYVNGEAILQDEVEYFMKRNKAETIKYYSEKYGVTDYSDFWDKEFNGKTPHDMLTEISFRDACEYKAVFLLMKEKHIYRDISFLGLKEEALKYNKKHKSEKAVGANTIDTESFYTYYFQTGEIELKNRLTESGDIPAPDEDEIREYIKNNPGVSESSAAAALTEKAFADYISELIEKAEIKTV